MAHVPDGCHAVIPYMLVADGNAVVDFITTVFDATLPEEPSRRDDGSLKHATLAIGDAHVMVGQPEDAGRAMQASIYIYVPDADLTYRKALAVGATSVMEPADQFYGDRTAGVQDAWGNVWWIGTHKG